MNNNIYYKTNLQTISNNSPRSSIDSSKLPIYNPNYNNYPIIPSSSPLIFNIPKFS